ncbi:MAG: VOC family protein [Kofleriaceae bacterium]
MAMIPTGRFVWCEYVSKDERKAQAFFGELFNWKTKQAPMPNGTYSMIEHGGRTIGGYLQPVAGGMLHPHWMPHLQVTSAKDTATRAKAAGGKVVKEPFKVGEVGMMAVIHDPFGAELALWQPARPEDADDDYKGLDGTWVWNELYANDIDRTVAFYKTIAGFEVERMSTQGGGPGPDRYELLKSDGKARAGVMTLAGVPQMWMPYVKVADSDATVEKAKRLGATIKMPPETMAGVGRLAVIIDPMGAPLGLLKPSPTAAP